jgi:hypothetical protein
MRGENGDRLKSRLESVGRLTEQHFEEVLVETLRQRREQFVGIAVQRLREVGLLSLGVPVAGADWMEISTLSQCRKVIGGRFEHLKRRWIGAGFPLREHRGDRSAAPSLDQGGWSELSQWIMTQGFEVKLGDAEEGFLFAVKRLGGGG